MYEKRPTKETYRRRARWCLAHAQHTHAFTGCCECRSEVSFRKRAARNRALLRKITYKAKASFASSPPCRHSQTSSRRWIDHGQWLQNWFLRMSTCRYLAHTYTTHRSATGRHSQWVSHEWCNGYMYVCFASFMRLMNDAQWVSVTENVYLLHHSWDTHWECLPVASFMSLMNDAKCQYNWFLRMSTCGFRV